MLSGPQGVASGGLPGRPPPLPTSVSPQAMACPPLFPFFSFRRELACPPFSGSSGGCVFRAPLEPVECRVPEHNGTSFCGAFLVQELPPHALGANFALFKVIQATAWWARGKGPRREGARPLRGLLPGLTLHPLPPPRRRIWERSGPSWPILRPGNKHAPSAKQAQGEGMG